MFGGFKDPTEELPPGHDTVCKILIQHSVDINSRNVFDASALDLAATAGHLQCVRVLVDSGLVECGWGSVYAANPVGLTALGIALQAGHRTVAEALLARPDWRLLLRRSNTLTHTRHKTEKETPMRKMIAKFPELASLVMDKCIT
ncbi:unnamed protein product, partial [Mesorhabditis spiculigera]